VKAHSLGEYIYDFGWAQAAHEAGLAYYPKLVLGAPLSPATAPRLIVAEDAVHPQALRRALWESAEALAREEGCSGVHVLFCTAEEAGELEDAGWARRLTLQFHWHNPGYRTLDDYLQRFDSKRRNQLKRELRAPQTQGLTLRTVRGEALGPEHARAAHDFYVHTCEQFAWGRVQLNREFFERAFRALPENVELVEALRGEERIAGAFNLAHEGILYGRYWGALEEVPFLHFNVCLYHSVEESIRLGRRRFEPGAGGEHKVSRGFVPSAIHSVHRLFDPALDNAVRRFLRGETLHHRAAIAEGETLAGLKPWRP
jgi:predicted N-acyltransferase